MATVIQLIGGDIDPNDLTPRFDRFSLLYCALIICLLFFPLLIMKQMNILIKIASYGVYFVSVIFGYVIVTGIMSLTNTSFDFETKANHNQDPNTTRHLYLFGDSPSNLMGILMSSYFSHSFILPILKNNQNPQNNKRDLFFGYLLVFSTYIIIGLMGYIGFSGYKFKPEFEKVSLLFNTELLRFPRSKRSYCPSVKNIIYIPALVCFAYSCLLWENTTIRNLL
jgi:hypothetical protein